MQENEVLAFLSEPSVRAPLADAAETPVTPSATEVAPELPPPLAPEIAFVSQEAQEPRIVELLGRGAIVVGVAAPLASMRGKLADVIDELVERALGVRGAPSPYLTTWSATDDGPRLVDQMARARSVGATGIVVAFGSLERIAAPALTPEDSAAVRAVVSAGCVVLIDDGDAGVGAFGEPVALRAMLMADAEADAEADAHAEADADAEGVEVISVELVETHVDAPVAVVDESERARRRATVGVPVAGPSDVWRHWAIALGAARGPQPLVAFEKLFTESYMPLANAIAAGLDDPRAVKAHDEFRAGFERSYSDAFATFGASSRRPRLVMDAFDVASKQARLHNARTTHVLVVDAMRYDLGCLVRDELAAEAQGTASLTSESLLWSALPTTTYRQLETLARGMDALRAPAAADEQTESLRGRSAETVRRLRVGSRELYKLDLVPAMLSALPDRTIGDDAAHVVEALGDIAASVADAILRHVETLPPRTLLLVLGDHGFTIDRRGRITHGNASPEEVLVPSLAYLVGDLH